MVIRYRQTVSFLLYGLLSILLLAGCELFDMPERDNPDDPGGGGPVGGTAFTEEHTPTAPNSTHNFIGDNSGNNVGLGQRILYPAEYLPERFSVWIDPVYPFKDGGGGGVIQPVTLTLRIWNGSGTLLGSGSSSLIAGYTGEVEFFLGGLSGAIPANTPVTYAVFVKTAIADDVRGQLERDNTNGYNPHADADMMSTFTAGTDANVDQFSTYSASSNDLRFKLTGRYF